MDFPLSGCSSISKRDPAQQPLLRECVPVASFSKGRVISGLKKSSTMQIDDGDDIVDASELLLVDLRAVDGHHS